MKELQAFPGILWVVVVSCSDSFKSSENLIAGSGLKTLGELLLSLPSIQDLRCLSPQAWVSPQRQLAPHSGIRASSLTGLAEEPEFWSEHPAYPRSPFQGVTGPAALPFPGKESDVSEAALVESRDWLCGTASLPEPVLPPPVNRHLCACLFIGWLWVLGKLPSTNQSSGLMLHSMAVCDKMDKENLSTWQPEMLLSSSSFPRRLTDH